MPETGLIVVGNDGQPIESIYALASNGLYLPKTIPPPGGWVYKNPYPEFAQALQEVTAEWFKPKPKPSFVAPTWLHAPKKSLLEPLEEHQFPLRRKSIMDIVPGMKKATMCPAHSLHEPPMKYCYSKQTVQNIIIHLNDEHHWTRERIADWIDTITNIDLTVKVI